MNVKTSCSLALLSCALAWAELSVRPGVAVRSYHAQLRAHRAGMPPVLDGSLNEPAWDAAPVATGFVQVEPSEGALSA
jgi:hypothetical protein